MSTQVDIIDPTESTGLLQNYNNNNENDYSTDDEEDPTTSSDFQSPSKSQPKSNGISWYFAVFLIVNAGIAVLS